MTPEGPANYFMATLNSFRVVTAVHVYGSQATSDGRDPSSNAKPTSFCCFLCCICLERLAATGLGRQTLPCGHTLHEQCIIDMARRGASGRFHATRCTTLADAFIRTSSSGSADRLRTIGLAHQTLAPRGERLSFLRLPRKAKQVRRDLKGSEPCTPAYKKASRARHASRFLPSGSRKGASPGARHTSQGKKKSSIHWDIY